MRLVSLLAAAGLVYAAYMLISQGSQSPEPQRRLPPPRGGHTDAGDGQRVRNAGPGNIDRDNRIGGLKDWDAVDEASDESFPASDPPARY